MFVSLAYMILRQQVNNERIKFQRDTSANFDRKTWLPVRRVRLITLGNRWLMVHQQWHSQSCWNLKRYFCLHTCAILISDWIYNMNHTLDSGTKYSSVILIQTKCCKTLKYDAKIMTKNLKPKREYIINSHNYNSNQFKHGEFLCSKTVQIYQSRQ